MNKDFHIGQTIRELRRQRKLTGEGLAKMAGLSQSKISKIETGAEVHLKIDEIDSLLNILEAPRSIRQQVLDKLGQPSTGTSHRFRVSYFYEPVFPLEQRTKFIRMFSMHSIPALLQTLEFRHAFLEHSRLSEAQHKLAVLSANKRQDLLWDKFRRFQFIMLEHVLYTAAGSHSVQIAQLDRLDRMLGVHNVKIGIVPTKAGLMPGVEYAPFTIYDDEQVMIVVANSEIISRDPADIAEYLKVFAAYDRLASYGDGARALVRKAINYFS